MDSDSRSYLIAALFLLILAFFFALCETAISSASKTKLKTSLERGDRRAGRALYVIENFNTAVTTLLICTNIVHILTASLVTAMAIRKWGLSAVSVSTAVTTIVVFFAGEMLPKSIAKKKPEFFAMGTAQVLTVLMKVLKPFSAVLTKIGDLVSSRLSGEQEVSVTEEEIEDIIEDYSEDGIMEEEQAELLTKALSFSKKKAGDIMTAAQDMEALSLDGNPEEIFRFLKGTTHSRIPCYKGSKARIEGMLSVREYFTAWYKGGRKYPEIKDILSKVYFTDPATDIDELLEKMSSEKVTMSVVSENGKALGIITTEDILEELVGDIYDENDRVPAKNTSKVNAGGEA